MNNDKKFKKNFIWNIIGTTFNSFNSLFFMIIVTRVNGTTDAGIFTLAFTTACILYMIGVYAGRIFQVTENEKINDKEYIINRTGTVILMIIISGIFVVIKGYEPYKMVVFILICLYKAIEAFSDVLYGILQKNDLLYQVGKSFFLKALIALVAFLAVDLITKNLIISSFMIVIANILVVLVYDIPNILKIVDIKQKIKISNVLRIYKTGFFIFAISFLGLYIMNAPKYAIDDFLTENIQAIYGIIIMPATVVGLLGQFIIHPYLNTIVKLYKENQLEEIKKIVLKIVLAIFVLGMICVLGAYILGIPVLELIYGINLKDYKINLVVVILASTLSVIGTIYSSILTTIRRTFIQFVIYCVLTVIAVISSYILTYYFKINGATGAYFIIMSLQYLLYYIFTKRILNKMIKEKKDETKSIYNCTSI